MSFNSLPAELKTMILDCLKDTKLRPYVNPSQLSAWRRYRGMPSSGPQALYACVNRDWQEHFEARNMRRLVLGHDDMEEFRAVMSSCPPRHRLVRGIWLRLELPEYGCNRCNAPESLKEAMEHRKRFTGALEGLFSVLSTFDADDHPGVTLELSAHSPSDSQHFCKELMNTIADTEEHVSEANSALVPSDDFRHGWTTGVRRPLHLDAYLRVFGSPYGLRVNASKLVARAPVVRDLLIRLQFPRYFSIRNGLGPIVERLPRLESIRYECREAASTTVVGIVGQTSMFPPNVRH